MEKTQTDCRKALRQEMGEKRAQLSLELVQAHSRLITARLGELAPILKARIIMGFAGIRNEVDLHSFFESQDEQGKTILLPRVEKDGTLTAAEFTGWQNTKAGAFNIMEPVGPGVSPSVIEAIIVPGLVFDGHGFRLGYGKGYYDRFLQLLPTKTFICGVCYDFQIVGNVYPHTGDVPVHWIVTEKSELAVNWDFF